MAEAAIAHEIACITLSAAAAAAAAAASAAAAAAAATADAAAATAADPADPADATVAADAAATGAAADPADAASTVAADPAASQDSLAAYYLGHLSLHDLAAPQHQRSTVPFDQVPNHNLPVIDFSAFFCHDRNTHLAGAAALRKLSEAAQGCGVFRLINHGIPFDLLQRLEGHADRFFTLPLEQKLKVSRIADERCGYSCGNLPTKRDKWWSESLRFSLHEETLNSDKRLWPDEDFCTDVMQYMELGDAISHRLRHLLTECLGLAPSYYDQYFEPPNTTGMRINYYPPCPEPHLIMGISEHTDPGTLTILHQNNVGGLQVQKNGKWMGVKPHMGSLIVNLGDTFQVFSNGRFKSGVHRAALNRDSSRLSFALFYGPKRDTVIQPAPGLLGDNNPPLYRPITWGDYLAYFFGGEISTKTIEYLKN